MVVGGEITHLHCLPHTVASVTTATVCAALSPRSLSFTTLPVAPRPLHFSVFPAVRQPAWTMGASLFLMVVCLL